MQIILQKNVANLGFVGDVVNVKDGYYRNFLAPRGLALLANAGSVKEAEHQKKIIIGRKAKEKSIAESLKSKLEALNLSITHAAGDGGKLFGSITAQELASTIRDNGFPIDRKQIKIEAPIKTVGEHPLEIKLHPEVSATVKLNVVAKA